MTYDEQHLRHPEISATSVVVGTPKDSLDLQKITKPRVESHKTEDLPLWKKFAIFVTSLGSFLALWEVAALLAGNSVILSGPIRVLMALQSLLEINSATGTLGMENVYQALFQTVEVVTLGFGLAVAVGLPVGVVMGRWKAVEMIAEPWISAINSIPIVVLIPSLYFSIGGGLFADVFIAFVLSVFTMIMNTHTGIKYTSSALAEVGRTFGATEGQYISKILLPASMPDIVAGMRIAAGRALLGAIMAEALLGANHGLGGFMITFRDILNTPAMMATVVLVALVGILFLQAPKLLERRVFKWKEGERISRGIDR